VHGDAEDFQALLELVAASDPANAESLPTRVLWRIRDRLWRLARSRQDLGASRKRSGSCPRRIADPGYGRNLVGRSIARGSAHHGSKSELCFSPFAPLYRTDVEFAAEISNQTLHGVIHLA
jgi:hypothetical protein